jgi:hypothetical protein
LLENLRATSESLKSEEVKSIQDKNFQSGKKTPVTTGYKTPVSLSLLGQKRQNIQKSEYLTSEKTVDASQ